MSIREDLERDGTMHKAALKIWLLLQKILLGIVVTLLLIPLLVIIVGNVVQLYYCDLLGEYNRRERGLCMEYCLRIRHNKQQVLGRLEKHPAGIVLPQQTYRSTYEQSRHTNTRHIQSTD